MKTDENFENIFKLLGMMDSEWALGAVGQNELPLRNGQVCCKSAGILSSVLTPLFKFCTLRTTAAGLTQFLKNSAQRKKFFKN